MADDVGVAVGIHSHSVGAGEDASTKKRGVIEDWVNNQFPRPVIVAKFESDLSIADEGILRRDFDAASIDLLIDDGPEQGRGLGLMIIFQVHLKVAVGKQLH